MTKAERMKEIMKANPDFGKGVGYKMCVVDELHDMKEQTCSNCKHFVRFNNACMEYGYQMSLCDKSKWEVKEND